MIVKRSLLLLLLAFFSARSWGQTDFDRQFHLQNLENQADEISATFNLNFNMIILDISQKADLSFIGNISTMGDHKNYFLASTYLKESNYNGQQRPGCIIFINYNNHQLLKNHQLLYKNILDEQQARSFTYYYLMAHEMGHCIAQNSLRLPKNFDEKYADAIAAYFITHSVYRSLFSTWLQNLQSNKPPHNTFEYVRDIYASNSDISSLSKLLERIQTKP